ncbi:uncharacterized protein CTHT_0021080 [Thermochaetoides thermophila DSM 1495]|uniref:C2H2-type domain-containing protein n=1 Tax=Chaetomium thermophilum (strain DSM 1495 / CBS 144.50 / IMI 039719) TaxID=759272 RepID=G0S3H7_CHATD|nr:hypothetical protein CTHT_0021080 [Thermochaetoides thermophila DSM 1495]EGS22560.1 hypothetical protein CTHT_0021080 [Thermochaetoides thermophila DSM 1495]
MAIRGAVQHEVPPPLPPPRYVPPDCPVCPSLQGKERMRREEYGASDTDSFGLSFRRPDFSLRNEPPDDGYHSLDSTRSSSAFLPRFGHHAMKSLRPGMDTRDSIDSSMLEKLNRSVGRSGLSTSLSDLSHTRHIQPPPITLSLPHRTKQPYLESIFTNSSGGLSATSPLGAPFGRSSSFAEGTDYDRAPYRNFSRIHGGSVSEDRNGCAYTGTDVRDDDVHFPMDDSETTRMRSLHIDDLWASRGGERERDWDRDKDWERDHRDREYYQPGQKRRASSPPGDEAGLGSDPLRRRDGALARSSPTPRLLMPHSSAPSICSVSRSGSHTNYLPTTSNLTGMGSFGRRSPSVISPGGLSPTDQLNCSNNYPTPTTLSAAPHALTGRTSTASSPHQRTHSEQPLLAGRTPVSPRKLPEIPKSSSTLSAKLKGPYMCECCPKKPKKFDTEEELRAHEAEKQYECSFCGNRFKNKNEAERHQNSLHVRRHSWSCAALTSYERAFHESTTRPGEVDICGYCGKEFNRTGGSQGAQGGLRASEQDWEERVRHLQEIHKFRECNASKKFYRADHFRQHLKHSHAGTSGKWTNMLENACMMEEEPSVQTR